MVGIFLKSLLCFADKEGVSFYGALFFALYASCSFGVYDFHRECDCFRKRCCKNFSAGEFGSFGGCFVIPCRNVLFSDSSRSCSPPLSGFDFSCGMEEKGNGRCGDVGFLAFESFAQLDFPLSSRSGFTGDYVSRIAVDLRFL